MNTHFHPGNRIQTFTKNASGDPSKGHSWEVWGRVKGEDKLLGTGKTLSEAESNAAYTVGTEEALKGFYI